MKTREHIGHNKINIIEIQSNKEEIKLIKKILKNYSNKRDELKKEKSLKIKDIEEFEN